MKTKIKICGLQGAEDIEMVNELMPEYAGLCFVKAEEKSAKKKQKNS